jgi:hypothetical protein
VNTDPFFKIACLHKYRGQIVSISTCKDQTTLELAGKDEHKSLSIIALKVLLHILIVLSFPIKIENP